MRKCKFTIVTVCYNAELYIRDTIETVLSQSYENFEYIIKDGKSSDRTMDIVQELAGCDKRVIIMQGKDRGIYDAMNVAVSEAKGEFVIFLNAGDKFINNDSLSKVAEFMMKNQAQIFYGNVIERGLNRTRLRIYNERNVKRWYYGLGACLCHQGMFCAEELFRDRLFDLNYKVCADREWQMYHISRGIVAKPMKFAIAEVLVEGFSKEHVKELEEETGRCIKQYCGVWYALYKLIFWLKSNEEIKNFIRRTEERISCKGLSDEGM